MPEQPRTTFPLCFRYEQTRQLLRFVAEQRGTSMNQLAEELIQRELETLALGLESKLSRTMELVREYRGERRQESWSRFAQAEALDDPIQTRRMAADDDPYGVAQAFEATR
ncbi:MAG: hypothetical protein ABIZ57_05455 [Candidatus Limnocylindria bacterium]